MIETLNHQITLKRPVTIKCDDRPLNRINYELLASLADYWKHNGAATLEMIEAQLKRTSLTCKTIKP